MWNSNKSLILSCICTKLVIVLVVVCALSLSKMMELYQDMSMFYIEVNSVKVLSLILYACCVPALAALFSLDRMLSNIKQGHVFVQKNARYLRIISWCCFGVAVLSALAGYYYLLFFFVAAVVAFIGLILRVVKNVIEQAIYIKAENDFTI